MRILVLSKRQYTGKDLLDDRYGRLFEIPAGLATAGHHVLGLALSYRPKPAHQAFDSGNEVAWQTMNARPFSPFGAIRHLERIHALCRSFQPDIVWASSDAWHAIAAGLICRPLGIPYVVDLYDNYESFGLTRLPGMTPLFRQTCRRAAGLTPVGETLNDYLQQNYGLPEAQPSLPLGNAVDTSHFTPKDKVFARQKLGLPLDGLLVGTAGALNKGRGISTLFEACNILSQKMPTLRIAIAGPRDATIERYRHLAIEDLGIISATDTPLFWNALDVAVIQNIDSAFGRYCYPQKLQEIIACGIPLVASSVGEVRRLLAEYPYSLVQPNSSTALADAINRQITAPQPVNKKAITKWQDRANELSFFFEKIIEENKKYNKLLSKY